MQNVESKYFLAVFPFLISSKFNLKGWNHQPSIKNLEISIDLSNYKNLPEIVFWVLFSLNSKKSKIFYYYKKRHISGKSYLTRVFLSISKKIGSKNDSIFFLNVIFKKMILLSREVGTMRSFPARSSVSIRSFSFDFINYEEKYNTVMNLSPNSWTNYDLKLFLLPSISSNGFYFRFLLQNLQIPIL